MAQPQMILAIMRDSMKEVNLPSGAVLKITLSPFTESRLLYQAVLEEFKDVKIFGNSDVTAVFKDIACIGFSSKKIEACLEVCFKRCLYNYGRGDLKIDKDSFESVENRADYIPICLAVAKENIMPFMSSLYAEFQQFLSKIPSAQA